LAADLESAFGESSELIQSSGGVFEVERDGTLLFSKKATGRFPEDGEVIAIAKAIDAGTPVEQAQQQAASQTHKQSFGEWIGKLFHA
jgi:selenoprotein W-related protein